MFKPFDTAEEARDYLFAGKSVTTLRSLKSGVHYTFKTTASEDGRVFFVKALVATDKYEYIGAVNASDRSFMRITKKSRMTADSKPVAAFNFMLAHVVKGDEIPETLEIRHEGTCGRCGRTLTHPDSIDRGIGLECIKRVCEAA